MAKSSDTLARLRARSVEAGRFVLPLEPVWADKLNDAHFQLRMASVLDNDDPTKAAKVAEAQAVVNGLEESAGDNVVVFRFRRLSRAQYDELVSAHPPSAAQIEREKDLPPQQRNVFDMVTFKPALLAEVCIDPKMTLEEAREMLSGAAEDGAPFLSSGESEAVVGAAMMAALSQPKSLPKELNLP